ncbi:MAG: phenylalanine--tRNA ligase subunit beta [Tidjanibacter sp.]|nr:phenylalanine--tRNA ligase subunit beta [Tidjanibacter sp.]
MNISFKWLKDYLKSDLTAEEAATILTDIGLEIEGFERVESIKGGLAGVVVGEVLTCTNHPDSDHLHLTTVDVGSGEPLQIVCGASNCRQGLKVMVATIGTTLYPIDSEEEFKIKKSKIRGVESFGMLCAEDELGIGRDHAGIMELNPEAVVGTPAKEYLGLEEDYLLEIGLTPNRVDAASHYGVARDLAAYLRAAGRPVSLSLPSVEDWKVDNTSFATEVVVEDKEGAPRYAGVNISGVTVAPSPEWLQNYLRVIGINPKNNVVDVTNFVLHELCQPLHSFDADKIEGNKIVVRTCAEGTKFTTLDGTERTLSEADLMICDATKPMCIAGVFGGAESGVTDSTRNVFLESAYFNPVRVRKSAKRHGLNTDSSFRFERGIDPCNTIYALKRAALLIKELAGGEITSEITDICSETFEPFRFDITFKQINSLIGKEIPEATIREILAALEVAVEAENDGTLSVAVPRYRVDVQRPADLIEDILRIYGYNNVEIPERMSSSLSYVQKPDKERLTNLVADMLSSMGFTEAMSNSLTKAAYYEELKAYPAENCVKIMNPLSADLGVMRQTLLFNMMEAVQLNTNHRQADLKLYEFGNCYYFNPSRKEEGGLAPYSERGRLAILVTGQQQAQSWNVKGAQSDYFFLKSVAEKLLRRFGVDIYSLQCRGTKSDLYDEAVSFGQGKELFTIGSVSSKIRKMFDIKAEVYFLELEWDTLLRNTKKHKVAASELPKFPEVKRDLALLVDAGVTFEELRRLAFGVEKKLLKSVSLFDVYQGDKLPAGKKSYALTFILRDNERTLDDKTIDRIMNNLIKQYTDKAGAQIR